MPRNKKPAKIGMVCGNAAFSAATAGDLLCMGTGNLLVVMKRSRNAPVIFAPGA
jgi:hypothetical protein